MAPEPTDAMVEASRGTLWASWVVFADLVPALRGGEPEFLDLEAPDA